jgi:hypothetical protein
MDTPFVTPVRNNWTSLSASDRAILARLAGAIGMFGGLERDTCDKHSFAAKSRFGDFYGQWPAQLDRLQMMFPTDVVQHKWLSTVANVLMWGLPQRYTGYLEDVNVNERIYADQWTHFMSVCLADWTTSLSWVRWHIEPKVDIADH